MMYMPIAGAVASPVLPEAMVMQAARLWREARNAGDPVQPVLHALFASHGYDMLAATFDSVMTLCESRFDRSLCTGCPLAPSADERLLCRLLAFPEDLSRIAPCRNSGSGGIEAALGCALVSARIMAMAAMEGRPQ